ncbi:hypothetical protein ABPG77_001125 [Micractinium sp. CCAP 211/92]
MRSSGNSASCSSGLEKWQLLRPAELPCSGSSAEGAGAKALHSLAPLTRADNVATLRDPSSWPANPHWQFVAPGSARHARPLAAARRLVAAALPQHDVITSAQEIGQQGALLVVPQQAAAPPPTLSMATALRLSLQAGGVQLHAVLPALQSALDFLSSQPSGSSSGGAPTAGSALSQLEPILAELTTGVPTIPLHQGMKQLQGGTRALVSYRVGAVTLRSREDSYL